MSWCVWPIAIILIISIFSIKQKYNPVTIFSGYWLLLMILSCLRLYDFPEVSNDIYVNVMLGVLSFACGYALYSQFNKNNSRILQITKDETGIRYNILKIFLPVILILLLMYLARTLVFLFLGFSLDHIRSNFTSLIVTNTYETILWSFIILPSTLALMPISLYAYAVDKKGKKYFLISLFATIFLSLCDGGRVYLMFYIIQFAFFVLLNPSQHKHVSNDKTKLKFSQIMLFMIIGYILIELASFITIERQIETRNDENLYVYFAGCFPYMEYKMTEIARLGNYAHGLAFFYAPLTFIIYPLKAIGLIDYPQAYLDVQNTIFDLQEYIKVGSHSFNAFASLFFYFYYDFGVLGICLGSAVFGAICCSFFKKMLYNKSARHMMVYSVIIIAIASSMVRWQFGRPEFFMSLIIIYLLSKHSKKRFV